MSFDSAVPSNLLQMQLWFSSVLATPLRGSSSVNPISFSGELLEEEASSWIVPSASLTPKGRIEIYCQQFWWRLLQTLHEQFPLLVRLFGYREFNEKIGTPYIRKYLPDHWSLALLGNRLSLWIEEFYFSEDRQLVLDAARIDWAYNRSFCTTHIGGRGKEEIRCIRMQPHATLFSHDYDLFLLRRKFLDRSVEYWEQHPFPSVKRGDNHFFVLYRSSDNCVVWERISYTKWLLCKRLEEGITLEELAKWIANQEDDILSALESGLQEWMQEGIIRGWLAIDF